MINWCDRTSGSESERYSCIGSSLINWFELWMNSEMNQLQSHGSSIARLSIDWRRHKRISVSRTTTRPEVARKTWQLPSCSVANLATFSLNLPTFQLPFPDFFLSKASSGKSSVFSWCYWRLFVFWRLTWKHELFLSSSCFQQKAGAATSPSPDPK